MKNVEDENNLAELTNHKGKDSNTTLLIFSVKGGGYPKSTNLILRHNKLAQGEGLKNCFFFGFPK